MIKLGRLSNQWPFRRGFVPSISMEELRGLYTTYDIQNYLGPTFYLRCIHNHVLKTLEEILRSEPWSFIHLALWWLCLTFTLIYFCLFICKSSQLFQQSHQECGQDYTRWSWKVLPHWSLHWRSLDWNQNLTLNLSVSRQNLFQICSTPGNSKVKITPLVGSPLMDPIQRRWIFI